MKTTTILFLVLLLLFLAGAGTLAFASSTLIDWDVIAGGGGSVSAGAVQISDTIGQPVIGVAQSGAVEIGSGYWYGAGVATSTGTPTPVVTPTDTPTPTTTSTATPTPTATPSASPGHYRIYLPCICK